MNSKTTVHSHTRSRDLSTIVSQDLHLFDVSEHALHAKEYRRKHGEPIKLDNVLHV